MRNIAIIVSILFALFTSCTEENIKYYSINGSGVASGDTLYLYGLDRRYEFMDTIIANNEGGFRYEIYADTIFPLSLIMPTGEALVLYAEPNLEATIFPDSTQQAHTDSIQPTPMDSVHHSIADSVLQKKWLISGGKLQQEYDSMAARIEGLSPEQRYEEIDSFVRRNPMSEVNIMLLRRYIVEVPSPSNRNIREILNNIGGKLNDNDYIKKVKEMIDKKRSTSTTLYSTMPGINFIAIDDTTKITNPRYKGKFLIINFWATWDTLSCKHVKEMGSLIDKHRKDTLMMLNISLDHDTAQWRKKVLSDTILGDNVCDMKMWDNNLVKRYGVSNLPYSILVNPKSLNINFNATPEKLNASLDSIIDVYKKEKKKEEKEKRERERKIRRKNKKTASRNVS